MTKELLAQKFLDKAEFKAVRKIDYNDLNELITEYFIGPHPEGKWWSNPYECVAYEEWGNYESHEFDVEKGQLDKNDLEDIEEAKKGEWPRYNTGLLLNYLCDEGVIPECELIVKISW